MSYYELSLEINPQFAEIAADFLMELGFEGVITEDVFINRENFTTGIKAYASELSLTNEDIKEKIANWHDSLIARGIEDNEIGSLHWTFEVNDDESWAENWKKFWDVQKIGNRTVICPSWLEYEPQENEIKITLDPGAAFGTGTHPTTRLCVRELEEYITTKTTVADIGCGSGILAIEAKLLGAKSVEGVDIDEESIRVANENAQINNTSCKFYSGTISDVKGSYDVVVANILAHIIVDIMPDLKRITKPDGIVILSGIIEEKTQSVKDAMALVGLEFLYQKLEQGNGENWMCIVGKNNA